MLEVRSLAKRYGDVLALTDLTVNVAESSCLVLLGRNGAGKTTALRCMAGVLAPSAGTVRVDGPDAASQPDAVRARVGLMPELPGLYERMSARSYLDYFGALYEMEPRTRAGNRRHAVTASSIRAVSAARGARAPDAAGHLPRDSGQSPR